MAGFLSIQSSGNQTEVFYIGYFGRAADGPGYLYWINDLTTHEAVGMSAETAAANIANSFAVQPEAQAQYSFLASPPPVLNPTDVVQIAGVDAFISQVYVNLFSHAPDTDGLGILADTDLERHRFGWKCRLRRGHRSDRLRSKRAHRQNRRGDGAHETNIRGQSGLGSRLPRHGATGRGVVDAATLSAIIFPIIAVATASPLPSPSDVIEISASNGVIDPGRGGYTIRFMGGVTGDTLVLHDGPPDQIVGFDPDARDVLDLRGLLAETTLDVEDVSPNPEAWFAIANRGADALLMFDPLGHGGGSTVAVPTGLGSLVTSFSSLMSRNAVQI